MTTRLLLDIEPEQWKKHLFGLSEKRWGNLQGKSFWITGAGTGYGRCLAIALVAAGAQVFLTGRRKQKLQETIDEMARLDISVDGCCLVPADITDFNQIKAACQIVTEKCNSLYGLINNAAIPARGDIANPLFEGSIEDWDKMMNTNVRAHWLITRTIFSHMIKARSLRVLFMSSEAGWAFTPGFGPYNISKAALNNLASSMAAEYANMWPDKDIQMNVLVAGEARTEMNQGAKESPYSIVPMALRLLAHPAGGPNGCFFHGDGRYFSFCKAAPYENSIL